MAKKKSGSSRPRKTEAPAAAEARSYIHPDATNALRPDAGVQAQFRKKKPPKTYRYDSSLSPALEWDEQPAREKGEELLARILDAGSLDEAKAAAEQLKAMSRPFLNWAGKAERQAFEVPTLPLFVHERLSTKAILETVKRHSRDRQVALDLFGDTKRDLADQVLRAYEHRDKWVNRMILGDSLVVMNSLLEYEGLGGQVQMIYMDPPYGVKFGSNFQPFVRKRDVKHGDDDDFTREPEMVQAYRDTWELGVHSYLSYLKDRFLASRDLLAESGSLFVQISDDNVHHVREILDEVFGANNFVCEIVAKKTGVQSSTTLPRVADLILWYAKAKSVLKYRALFSQRLSGDDAGAAYSRVLEPDGGWRSASDEEQERGQTADGRRLFSPTPLTSDRHGSEGNFPVSFKGKDYQPPLQSMWKTTRAGLDRLLAQGRIVAAAHSLRFVRYINDFPAVPLTSVWSDLGAGSFTEERLYVVQTRTKAIQRCLLLCTDPGDLVLDPTCGSGTTAYAAEQWGRRWITIDTSRVPLALARQRLLTAAFPWYELKDDARGPSGGFVYKRKQNSKGEEVGGIVPHITLKSIANDEPPAEEVLVDRPEELKSITRVTGPFVLEATIPTPVDFEGDGIEDSGAAEGYADFVDRMVEVLRRSPELRLPGNQTVRLEQVRRPAKTLSLSAEAVVAGKPIAVVFGPEHGAVSEKLVFHAGKEAGAKHYTHLYVFGFEVEPNARKLVEEAEAALGIPATYVAATPDLVLGDLLKTMRSSQVFSVAGLPEIRLERVDEKGRVVKEETGGGKAAKGSKGGSGGGRGEEPAFYRVTLLGMDTFDPATMEVIHKAGGDVPAWFLDTDYDPTRCFRVCQAFFPKTGAWDNLKRELRAEYEESLWDHLSGTTSAPFELGEQQQVAVKVIDERGNELVVVRGVGA